jgi:FkbM family methyltransferase
VISYAQNAEDVVLARLFAGRDTGRYVDVGAGDPVEDSVTKHFYDLGWRGINIEPIPELADEFRRQRPDDVTLAVALGARSGTATLHVVANWPGLSTVDEGLADRYHGREDLRVREVPVSVRTLSDVLDEYPGPVDFLKIDVEAAETVVIQGADFTRHRPRVLVVEATEPGSPTHAYQDWEPLLVAAGYRCALFDGLNRFYAAEDDTEALARLAAPANVFDKFERAQTVRERAALADLRVRRTAETGYLRRLEDAVREAQEGRAKDVEYLETLQNALREAHQEATKTRRYVTALENRVTELEAGQAEAASHIAMLEQRLDAKRDEPRSPQ